MFKRDENQVYKLRDELNEEEEEDIDADEVDKGREENEEKIVEIERRLSELRIQRSNVITSLFNDMNDMNTEKTNILMNIKKSVSILIYLKYYLFDSFIYTLKYM